MNSIPSTNQADVVENKSQFSISLTKHLISPIVNGFYGFALVFSGILMLKLISFLYWFKEVFNLELMDVMLSSAGFFFIFIINILKNLL